MGCIFRYKKVILSKNNISQHYEERGCKMKGIMIQGCTSDAGKSYVATGLCKILSDMGYKVSPFKSQNMSNNSYVTYDGKEIGRAQGVQAEAAGIRPETYMNPILLKPKENSCSEVVLFGEVYKSMSGREYQETFTRSKGLESLRKALKIIEDHYDAVVIEGAGSPAEVNLNDKEIVNMCVAEEADVPVILVVDINKGGALASVVGTLELVGENRKHIKGIIFNQFRGDISLFDDAVRWTENYTGVKVVGVLPYFDDIHIEGEDSLSINFLKNNQSQEALHIGIVRLPFISNHTDMEAFQYEKDVSVNFIDPNEDLSRYDGIILPGTKSTIADLEYLEEQRLDKKLKAFQGSIYGICGGYQIMGETLIDEEGIDFRPGYKKDGLGLLPVTTRFCPEKRVCAINAKGIHPLTEEMNVAGYEIHLGRTEATDQKFLPMWEIQGVADGYADKELHRGGSYIHNIFHNDNFRCLWLNQIRKEKGLPEKAPIDTAKQKQAQYNKLGEYMKQYLDMDYILELLEKRGNRQ